MKKLLQIALGIIAAIGGFVDIGDIVFNSQAGGLFGYQLLWAVPVGVLGIIVFAEMSGRIAAIGKKANFELVRERYGRRLGLATLVSSLVLNFLTLAAEMGGIGLVLQLFFDVSGQFFMLVGLVALLAAAWFLPFSGIERIFGYCGLGLLVYVFAGYHLHPDWSAVGHGFVPTSQSSSLYWYFAVGVIAAAFMPYEIYFYSSGGIEEKWDEKDLGVNRANAIIGFGLGGTLAVALMVVAAQVLHPNGINPDTLGTVPLTIEHTYGETGLVFALVGILFAVGGAAIDTCFSGAYNLAQYFGWPWGKRKGHRGAPRWYLTWILFLIGGYCVIATGINPVELTEYAVVFSVIALPLTYLPVLLAARDPQLMGDHTNGLLANTLGWAYFVVICALSVAAPVLFAVTNGGGG